VKFAVRFDELKRRLLLLFLLPRQSLQLRCDQVFTTRRASHTEILNQLAGLHDRLDFGLRDGWGESPPSSAGCAEIRPPPSAKAPPEPASGTFPLRGTPRPPSGSWLRIAATSRCVSLARRRRRPAPLRPSAPGPDFAECGSSASCIHYVVDLRAHLVWSGKRPFRFCRGADALPPRGGGRLCGGLGWTWRIPR
jgi:hypothetical protein